MQRRPWWLVKPRLAVVLSGGAAPGAFEVGVIDVMARRGLVPDLLVGTSVGAINAAFYLSTFLMYLAGSLSNASLQPAEQK